MSSSEGFEKENVGCVWISTLQELVCGDLKVAFASNTIKLKWCCGCSRLFC